jgi:hypothetical protein
MLQSPQTTLLKHHLVVSHPDTAALDRPTYHPANHPDTGPGPTPTINHFCLADLPTPAAIIHFFPTYLSTTVTVQLLQVADSADNAGMHALRAAKQLGA